MVMIVVNLFVLVNLCVVIEGIVYLKEIYYFVCVIMVLMEVCVSVVCFNI